MEFEAGGYKRRERVRERVRERGGVETEKGGR